MHNLGSVSCQYVFKRWTIILFQGVQNAAGNSTPTHVSIEKLLSNRLARQVNILLCKNYMQMDCVIMIYIFAKAT